MDGSVVAGLITACGTGAAGAGGIVAAVLSRRSAREAEAQAQAAGRDAAAANASKLGYDTLVFSVQTLQNEVKRLDGALVTERLERRTEAAAFRREIVECHTARDDLAAQVHRLTNGA